MNDPAPVQALPVERDGPLFDAPWQARAFALLTSLHASQGFAWSDWVSVFSAQRAADEAGDADPGYYRSWVCALELMLERGGWSSHREIDDAIEETRADWPHPAHEAHREPIARDPARRR
ncbi:nitrile hydratase accessory protein [Pseudaminobacter salicylatoxidans]|uniref:Nitrile hydratase accessory protein n=1 Tax=Pseudaminobacter salicylatoxidans TaxID=93369 RepID=A0A7G6KSY5_PSESE|nr:nitrile hydratase accessory protein [Pseudaminobacter salicylatoxidans]QNC71622.1 nitrile hydratase accessory protein [Pseudaminobacter salicylatoxidans]